MKRLVILGGGMSGAGTAVLAKEKGYDVFLSDRSTIKAEYKQLLDDNQIAWEEGQHTEALILNATEVVKSPGIPNKAPIVSHLCEAGVPILSEIEFAARYTDAKMICITGSNGKTTTTLLTYYMLREAGVNVALAGNVGESFALQVAHKSFDYYVIELSSFQLEHVYRFKADIAVVMNITPDHLDRYHYDLAEYADAKMRILQNQSAADSFIYMNDDPVLAAALERTPTAAVCCPFADHMGEGITGYEAEGELRISLPQGDYRLAVDKLALSGKHNLYNSITAATIGKLVGLSDEQISHGLMTFGGVAHRLEYITTIDEVRYINDSKATNVNSCWYALQSMTTPVVLILGGTDKGNDYSEIASLVDDKVRVIVAMGVDNSPILHYFGPGRVPIVEARSMTEALDSARRLAKAGDTVLLSPCCASFDLFKNYEDRGDQFRRHLLGK